MHVAWRPSPRTWRARNSASSGGHGVAQARGLPGAQNEGDRARGRGCARRQLPGIVFNLDEDGLGVILLGESERAYAGARMVRTGRVADIAVGESLLGRVISAVGARWTNSARCGRSAAAP
ncbi:MAG: hypothetical protein R2851_08900 [Caldilineaceae bacterium]